MTTTTAEARTSAREALQAGLCSASCLLSHDTGRCQCRCGGAHHGALLASLLGQAQPPAAIAADQEKPNRGGTTATAERTQDQMSPEEARKGNERAQGHDRPREEAST